MKNLLLIAVLLYSDIIFSQTIALQQFSVGFSNPVAIVSAGDSRLFVVERGGLIRVLNADGSVNAAPFLTLTASTIVSGGEQGLLGLAFHPNFATNRFFYVNYTRAMDGATVIAKYTANATNTNIADATSVQILLTIAQPFTNHNGGSLVFGPDGFLYIGMGDGGSGGDPNGNSQNLNSMLGKMLRIDVNVAAGYGIPANNPFAGTVSGADEIWAVGLRNPWKFSFDRNTGDLWMADVGQDVSEEINKANSSEAGLNYGWRCYEGNTAFNTTGCAALSNYKFPITTYSLAGNFCSSTGGYSYTGSAFLNFKNKYFFADFCTNQIGWIPTSGGAITWSNAFTGNISTFGEDVNGELYVAGLSNGIVYKLVDTTLETNDFSSNELTIYPNPAQEFVTVNNPNLLYLSKINVYDALGNVVKQEEASSLSQITIHTSSFASGIYFISLEDRDGRKLVSKLIKK